MALAIPLLAAGGCGTTKSGPGPGPGYAPDRVDRPLAPPARTFLVTTTTDHSTGKCRVIGSFSVGLCVDDPACVLPAHITNAGRGEKVSFWNKGDRNVTVAFDPFQGNKAKGHEVKAKKAGNVEWIDVDVDDTAASGTAKIFTFVVHADGCEPLDPQIIVQR